VLLYQAIAGPRCVGDAVARVERVAEPERQE
jgi:hypothetical protein